MSISKTITELMTQQSWIRKMFEEGIKLKECYGRENVFDFTLGNPYLEPPKEFLDALKKVVYEERKGIHGYMQNNGFPETREKIAKEMEKESGLPFDKNNIIMSCGAAGALNIAIKTILDPDDEVILIAPYFVEYHFYVPNHQGKIAVARAKKDFSLDIEDIEKNITERTKAILLNSPCNPTGRVFSKESIEELGDLLRRMSKKYNKIIYLISDEAYKALIFDGLEYPTPLKVYDETLVAMSYSKALSIAGERIGYLAISPLCKYKKEIADGATFTNRTLGFINAPALMQRVITKLDEIKLDVTSYQKKRDVLFNALTSYGYKIQKPEGTFYMFPKSPLEDDVAFVRLLQKNLVLTSPGIGFSYPGYFRIAFCTDDEIIERSLPVFKKVIEEIKD